MTPKDTKNPLLEGSAVKVDIFNDAYFQIHKHIVENGKRIPSRYGDTIEILNFKTEINQPSARCIGGKNRNVNIYFLLAEAIWIWCGRRDVKFLETFNSQMKEFSDNGTYFHAPYGWRLRNFGVDSNNLATDSNRHSFNGRDQIAEAINAFSIDKNDRRVVGQIWNSEFDLGKKSKDIPCNDLLMWKIREDKLHITIQNRSNDLDWGLCTNVFQFSFLNEVMANIIDVKVGTQVHNSQSLHLYDSNSLTMSIENNKEDHNLYDKASTPRIDFDFGEDAEPLARLGTVDFWMKSIVSRLLWRIERGMLNEERNDEQDWMDNLFGFSEFLYMSYNLLRLYIDFKNKVISRAGVLQKLLDLNKMNIAYKSDYIMLAMNFYVLRYETNENIARTAEIDNLIKEIRSTVDANIGKY